MTMLSIRNLYVSVNNKPILRGVNLEVNPGEVHAVMGPNGSGKSTLAFALAGRTGYVITHGEIRYQGRDLLAYSVDERARAGIFLAFQYPVELPGVANIQLLKAALNTQRRERGMPELDAMDFMTRIEKTLALLEFPPDLLQRNVNEGFSGGEKKRNEILQMAVLEPTLAVLDETDSGLDIDAIKVIANGVNALRRDDRAIILITHYQRLLNHIVPDKVHVLSDGQIVKTGGLELAEQIEARGYGWLQAASAVNDRPRVGQS